MLPIKLHIYDKELKIKQSYIFVGHADKEIQTILGKSTSIRPADEKKLKKCFGPKWRMLLNLEKKNGGGGGKMKIREQPKTGEGPQISAGGEESDEDEITLAELDALSNIQQLDEDLADEQSPTQNVKSNARNIYVFDYILNPHDKILEFKKKVALLTGIPIFKQHIWYEQNGVKYSLAYNIYVQNKVVPVSFNKFIAILAKDKIENIPVSINFYNIKNLLSIKAYDTFTILESIVNAGTLEFHMIGMDTFIPRDKITGIVNKNEIEILYFGLVVLFWPMIQYTVWIDYVNNAKSFEQIYPDLFVGAAEKKMFFAEQKITDEARTLAARRDKTYQDIEKKTYLGITYANILVTSPYTGAILNLRNLFDKFRLNQTYIAIKCVVLHNGQKIILNKIFKNNEPIKINIPIRSLLLRIATKLGVMDLYFFNDGNYVIKAKWPEENLYNFDDIIRITHTYIDPVIEIINKFGAYVLRSNTEIVKMTAKNVKFSEVYMSLIFREDVKYKDFKVLENILRAYEEAGIILMNQVNPANNTIEYYFTKGMYRFDAARLEKQLVIDNYYSFLTNAVVKTKWQQLFDLSRNTLFQFRHGDIKIAISGIRENEFSIFYLYVITALYKMRMQADQYPIKKIPNVKQKRNVKTLRQEDPVLYDFKKLYNSPIIYSKLCQKPYQPIILSKDELKELNAEERSRVVEYWNFTTNSQANYFCPNPRFPHIQFSIKKHPLNYCLPCCKKRMITDNDNVLRKKIFDTCIKEHEYKMEKVSYTQDIKYIMNYGKFISPGRICNLPESSIEPLLYENFSEQTSGVEPQCEEQNRYYVYGIEQNTENMREIGYVVALALSLELPIKDLVHQAIQKIKADPSFFRILLDGNIGKYFYSAKDLTTAMYEDFFHAVAAKETAAPWNDIFMDLAYYYYQIITILFIDKSHNYENIKLVINNKNADLEQVSSAYRLMLVIKKHRYYNPIYLLNPVVFFRTKMISVRLYEKSPDGIFGILHRAISFVQLSQNATGESLTLSAIQNFIKSGYNKRYKISAYYINDANLCYYIELREGSGGKFYFPVKYSPYVVDATIESRHEPYLIRRNKTPFSRLNEFIKQLNHWIALESESRGYLIPDAKKTAPIEQRVTPIYSFVRVEKWLWLNNPYTRGGPNAVIGFRHDNINYYHEPITKTQALKLRGSEEPNEQIFEQLLYHPDDVNSVLADRTKPAVDLRAANITRNIYDFYLYELLLLEFTEYFNKEKNAEIRHQIKKIILRKIDQESNNVIEEISKIIENYFRKFDEPENSVQDDLGLIISQINQYLIEHHDKKILFSRLDSIFFNFDRLIINRLKTLPNKEIIKELIKIAKRFILVIPDAKVPKMLNYKEEFPNMFISCQSRNPAPILYCKQHKLVIGAKKISELLEILAADIQNPFKQKWLFNVIFTDQIINYFRFTRNPGEQIFIEVPA